MITLRGTSGIFISGEEGNHFYICNSMKEMSVPGFSSAWSASKLLMVRGSGEGDR